MSVSAGRKARAAARRAQMCIRDSAFPERAADLFEKAANASKDRYAYLNKLTKLYAPDDAE